MAKETKDLLLRLQKSANSQEKRRLRKRLRLLGHSGGLNGKAIKIQEVKPLTKEQKAKVDKHNQEVSRRIASGKYKPLAPTKEEEEVRDLVKQFKATGRIACIHPRKKTVSLSGFPPISYEAAARKIKAILKGTRK